MKVDLNLLLQLIPTFVTLASIFGIYYKMKYQIEQLEKKQDKHNSVIERQYAVESSVEVLREMIYEIRKDVDELKGVKNGGQVDARTS